jgi:cell division protein FtsW (lipid II flippase)
VDILQTILSRDLAFTRSYLAVFRILAPLLAIILLWRCCRPLLTFRREPEIWGFLCFKDGKKQPITHWESIIGRHQQSDLVVDFPTVSRNHAVLTRYDDGSWTITDTDSKDGVEVNGKKVTICPITEADTISIGGVEMKLEPVSEEQEEKLTQQRTKASTGVDSIANLLLLSVFQALTCLGFLLGGSTENALSIFTGFAGIMCLQWVLLFMYFIIRRPAFEVETAAFFLCTLGMAAICTVHPEETVKQLIALILGLLLFLTVGGTMRNLELAKNTRYLAAIIGILLLFATLLFGTEYYGAKNWLILGPMSLQPSELSKVCFVFVGASTMDRLVNKRNLILFIGYTLLVCACLAVMNDFGTALVFFCAFLMIAFLRSGSLGTVGLAITALGYACVLGLKLAPHALRRFSVWRHVWESPFDAGYQQTRAMMCIASGGMFGLGLGRGWLKHLFAADSDVVFATIAEEWGLIMAVLPVLVIAVLALFAMRCSHVSRSTFYAIGACTAGSIMLVQTIFNVLGTVDVLPLTGVTFPFVSNGGSSMICAWGLLAFIKSVDTRQNASFAVRLGVSRR